MGFLVGVSISDVSDQLARGSETRFALFTLVGTDTLVGVGVIGQCHSGLEGQAAIVALVRPVVRVRFQMPTELESLCARIAAMIALENGA